MPRPSAIFLRLNWDHNFLLQEETRAVEVETAVDVRMHCRLHCVLSVIVNDSLFDEQFKQAAILNSPCMK